MILKLKRTPGIYLVGFMGSGKSTVGAQLAWELGWRFVDLDAEIAATTGMAISEIFDKFGEPEFRRIEAEAIRTKVREVEKGSPLVVALGGGAFTQEHNIELLEENGVTIWLECPLEVLSERIRGFTDRPLARDSEQFRTLFNQRVKFYERAEYRINSACGDPDAVVQQILKLPIF